LVTWSYFLVAGFRGKSEKVATPISGASAENFRLKLWQLARQEELTSETLGVLEMDGNSLAMNPQTNLPITDGLGFLDFLIGYLVETLESNSDGTFLLKHNIEIAQRELAFLREFLEKFKKQHNEYEELTSLWVQIVGVAYEVEYVVDSYVANGGGTIWYHMLSDVLEEISHIKESVKNFSEYGYECTAHSVGDSVSYNSMSQQTEKPKVNEVVVGFQDVLGKLKGFLDFLIGYLVETLESNSDRTFLLKHNIEIAQRELAFLREFLENFKKRHNEYKELTSLWVQIVGVAYEVEYVVDSYVANGGGTIWYHVLSDVLEEISHIKESVKKFSEYGYECTTHSVGDSVSYNSMSLQTEKPKVNEVVVGFQDVLGKLK
ncbi:hypothetical protein HAX54_010287, partial [Datura stramonium]|nr:hypothetical protein [Datura stramonium]